jgi:hypothetical protein
MIDRSLDKKEQEDCSINSTNTSTIKVTHTRNASTASKVSDSDTLSISRAARLKKRNGDTITDVNLPGIDFVKVVVEGDEDELMC